MSARRADDNDVGRLPLLVESKNVTDASMQEMNARCSDDNDDDDDDHDDDDDDEGAYLDAHVRALCIPPPNFSLVLPGVYRSGYPSRRNFEYMRKIGLRSVLCLCVEEPLAANTAFYADHGIRFFHCGFAGNLEPFQSIPVDRFALALNLVLDPANHPILVHCNRGKHRTGCLMAVVRRMCGWTLSSALDEYARFAKRTRYLDSQFIELFDTAPYLQNV